MALFHAEIAQLVTVAKVHRPQKSPRHLSDQMRCSPGERFLHRFFAKKHSVEINESSTKINPLFPWSNKYLPLQ